MPDETRWLYFRTRYPDGTEVVIRVSPWAAGHLAKGVGVATIFSDHPDEIVVSEDGSVSEHYDSDNQWQGTAGCRSSTRTISARKARRRSAPRSASSRLRPTRTRSPS